MWPWSSSARKSSEAWADVTRTGPVENDNSGAGSPRVSDSKLQLPGRRICRSESGVESNTSRRDSSTYLSARQKSLHDEHHGEDEETELSLQPSFPLPLIGFVSALSILAGLVVTGVHYAIVYSGCPLGLNGCNSFMDKESKGFFLVNAVTRLSKSIPEDVVYIVMSVVGALIYVVAHHRLPEHLASQIRGGGTIQSLIAVATGERITLTAAGLRILLSSLYLGSGGTLGFDGPAIQVCTAATTCVGWSVGMRSMPTQSLLACLGFAAGFAASFNSPLAGILFSMEELQHVSSRLSKHIICLILMASIIATAVARFFSGNQQLLQVNWGHELFESVEGGSLDQVFGTQMWMLTAVPIGIVCSFWGYAMSRSIRWIHRKRKRLNSELPYSVAFILQALLVGCIGSFVFRCTTLRGVWGIGYESLQEAFNRDFLTSEYLVFAFGKSLAMVLAVSLRAPGDMLEPVLISGAFLGGSIGRLLQEIIQDELLASQVLRPCLLFGMVGLFASCFRFPLTPVVIVLELMGVETYALVLPAALAGFTAITVSNRLFPPLLDEVMHEDAIDLHKLSAEADAAHAAEHCPPADDFSDDQSVQETEPESESEIKSRCQESESSCSSHLKPPSVQSRQSRGSRKDTNSSRTSSAMHLLLHNIEASMHQLSTSPAVGHVRSDASGGGAPIAHAHSEPHHGNNLLLRSLEQRGATGSRSPSRSSSTNPSHASSGHLTLNLMHSPTNTVTGIRTDQILPNPQLSSVNLSSGGCGHRAGGSSRQSSVSQHSGHDPLVSADQLKTLTLLERSGESFTRELSPKYGPDPVCSSRSVSQETRSVCSPKGLAPPRQPSKSAGAELFPAGLERAPSKKSSADTQDTGPAHEKFTASDSGGGGLEERIGTKVLKNVRLNDELAAVHAAGRAVTTTSERGPLAAADARVASASDKSPLEQESAADGSSPRPLVGIAPADCGREQGLPDEQLAELPHRMQIDDETPMPEAAEVTMNQTATTEAELLLTRTLSSQDMAAAPGKETVDRAPTREAEMLLTPSRSSKELTAAPSTRSLTEASSQEKISEAEQASAMASETACQTSSLGRLPPQPPPAAVTEVPVPPAMEIPAPDASGVRAPISQAMGFDTEAPHDLTSKE